MGPPFAATTFDGEYLFRKPLLITMKIASLVPCVISQHSQYFTSGSEQQHAYLKMMVVISTVH